MSAYPDNKAMSALKRSSIVFKNISIVCGDGVMDVYCEDISRPGTQTAFAVLLFMQVLNDPIIICSAGGQPNISGYDFGAVNEILTYKLLLSLLIFTNSYSLLS